jgi:hypothetical protein
MISKLGAFFGKAAAALTPASFETAAGAEFLSAMRGATAKSLTGARALAFKAGPGTFDSLLRTQQAAFYDAVTRQATTPSILSRLGISGKAGPLTQQLKTTSMLDWARGFTYRDKLMQAMGQAPDIRGMRTRMAARLALPGLAVGGYASGKIFGEGSKPQRAIGMAGSAAIHGAIGTGLAYGANPKLGYGYLAWSAFNGIRSGNRFGPL